MTEFRDILKLAELLNPRKSDNFDDEDELDQPTVKDLGPSDLKSKPVVSKSESEKNKNALIERTSNEDLDPEEQALRLLESENGVINDWRKTPQWDVAYRQQVTTNDVFLQMSGRTPATSSCENMILTVHLPGESRQNVDLKITSERLELLSSHFRLSIPLPHPVDPQKGNAQFDSAAEKLIITLQLNREFDYVNF